MIRSYSQLKKIKGFEARYEYLKLGGLVGQPTFDGHRYLNQLLYTSPRWRSVRNLVIIRDEGCDLGIPGCEINDKIFVHHMNPITVEDVIEDRDSIYDIEYLICTSMNTHNAIHFSDSSLLPKQHIERRPGDTTPWL